MCVACLMNASRGSDKKIYVIMFAESWVKRGTQFDYDKIKKRSTKTTTDEAKMKRESRYDEKEKLIQSHHLNIKTFPQTPLDCVIQLSAFYIVYMRIWKTPHYTIDNSCLMKMLRFCISQMSFFMDFIIIAANSCCCCMDYTRDTTPSNQEKRTL